MWDLIRWAAAIMAFIARWVGWLFGSTPVNELDGIEYYEEPTRVGVRARVPAIFEIGTKGGSSIFRMLAPGPEHATGDAAFDDQAYVQCNHPALLAALRNSERVRSTLLQLFAGGARIVSGDGRVLWIEGKRDQTTDDLHLLFELRTLLEAVELGEPGVLPHFGPRIAAVESVIWVLVAYGWGSVVESFVTGGDLHVNPAAVAGLGFLVAVALAGVLFVLVGVFLRRSPKGVLFVLMGVFLRGSPKGRTVLSRQTVPFLLCGLAWAGPQLVSDLNRYLDSSNQVIIKRTIIRREARTRKYGTYYWLYLSPDDGHAPIHVGSSLQVSPATYWRSLRSPNIELHVRSGRLGLAWYQSIVVGSWKDIPHSH